MADAPRDYAQLIPSANRQQPKFAALVALLCGAVGEVAGTMKDLPELFDLDVAEGDQLDAVGEWVGATRDISLPRNIFFSWNTAALGWNQGVWKGPFTVADNAAQLDDLTFRRVLRAKVLANNWDGTHDAYQQIFRALIVPGSGSSVRVRDNQDMSVTVIVTGNPLDQTVAAVLTEGALSNIRPAGVRIDSFVLPT